MTLKEKEKKLKDDVGCFRAVLAGSLLFASAPLITSYTLATSLTNVVASYGVLSSAGQNLAILPTLTLSMACYPRRRGLVAGVVVSGFGLGALFFNQVNILWLFSREESHYTRVK
jgi:hypothetical protein